MLEYRGDIWDFVREYPCRYLLVPTNGCWTSAHHQAIMGAGFAQEVARRYPLCLSRLGSVLRENFSLACSAGTADAEESWNIPYALISEEESGFGGQIYSFPTKRTFITEGALLPRYRATRLRYEDADFLYPGWQGRADLELIHRSAALFWTVWSHQTQLLTEDQRRVVLPRPGAGQGDLAWEEVRAVLAPIFVDDSFVIVDRHG